MWFLFIFWQWWFFWTEQYYWRCLCSICSFLSGNQGVVRISGQKHTWTHRGSSQRGHYQIATGNWSWSWLFDIACGSFESQEHKNYVLPENTESFKLQANQGSNECIHWEGKHQIRASRDNSLCYRGETCLETGATENLWESIGRWLSSLPLWMQSTSPRNGIRFTKCMYMNRSQRHRFPSDDNIWSSGGNYWRCRIVGDHCRQAGDGL